VGQLRPSLVHWGWGRHQSNNFLVSLYFVISLRLAYYVDRSSAS